jgi:hypothetical protein
MDTPTLLTPQEKAECAAVFSDECKQTPYTT